MLTRREIIERNCQLELTYISKSIDWEKFFGTSSTHEDKMETLVNSILKGANKVKGGKDIFRDEKTLSLKDTPWYLMAQITQTEYVTDWNRFKEEIRRKLPSYAKNPRGALKLLGLPWKLKFGLPELKRNHKLSETNKKRYKGRDIPKPGLREMPVELRMDTKALEDASAETMKRIKLGQLQELENEIADLKERLNELTDFVLTEALGFDKYERVKKLIRG